MKNKSTNLLIVAVIFLFGFITITYCNETTDKSRISIGLRAKSGDKVSEKYLIEKLNKYAELSIMAREGRGYVGGEEKKWHFVDSVDKAIYPYGVWLETIINELFLCGTNECLKAAAGFFAKFQPRIDSMGRVSRYQHGVLEPLTGPRSPKYIDSPREFIIKGFRRHHPELPLLHAEYDSLRHRFERFWPPPPPPRRPPNTWDREAVITEYMEKFLDWGNKTYGTNFKLDSKLLFTGQYDLEHPRGRKQFEYEERHLKYREQVVYLENRPEMIRLISILTVRNMQYFNRGIDNNDMRHVLWYTGSYDIDGLKRVLESLSIDDYDMDAMKRVLDSLDNVERMRQN